MPLLIYDRLLLLCDAVYATSQHDLSCADPFRSSNLTVIIPVTTSHGLLQLRKLTVIFTTSICRPFASVD
jgi:hypothetical protein